MTTTPEPTKGVPLHDGNSTFTPRADHDALGEWVRDKVGESVANFAALPASDNWVGRTITTEDSGAVYWWDGSGWFLGVEDTGWINATPLTNSWTSVVQPAYRRLNAVVYLRGRITGGSGVAFTLPFGFRPAVAGRFAVPSATGSTSTRILIGDDGTLFPEGGSEPNLNVSFPAS